MPSTFRYDTVVWYSVRPGGTLTLIEPEGERAELECGPVQVGAELLGHSDILRGDAAVVFEGDSVRPGTDGWRKPCVP